MKTTRPLPPPTPPPLPKRRPPIADTRPVLLSIPVGGPPAELDSVRPQTLPAVDQTLAPVDAEPRTTAAPSPRWHAWAFGVSAAACGLALGALGAPLLHRKAPPPATVAVEATTAREVALTAPVATTRPYELPTVNIIGSDAIAPTVAAPPQAKRLIPTGATATTTATTATTATTTTTTTVIVPTAKAVAAVGAAPPESKADDDPAGIAAAAAMPEKPPPE